ncbi:G-PROTEIN-RECEP-F1-2 domain-containing protein [Aphelenchoides besseyi]|nr:G-PROTEIN-RECEP-F1-2 domain-containing protein [Aphelenchoides besseyi]
MSFFKPVDNASLITDEVPALQEYVPNSLIYVILYFIALPPNILLAYMGLKPGLITSRVKFPTLGMTMANLFGLIGFLLLNFVYLFAVFNEVRTRKALRRPMIIFSTNFRCLWQVSCVRFLYNTSYVCYFLFPVLAIDQYLYVCQNYQLSLRSLAIINGVCFAIPMVVAIYDLFLQSTVLFDYMFLYVTMSQYTNVFFFFVLAPSFFIFSFVCNLLVLSSILRRQSKTARKSIGRSLNPRQLQQQKGVVFTYTLQAFMPLVLATPYYAANLCFMFNIEINLEWFVIGEAIICNASVNQLVDYVASSSTISTCIQKDLSVLDFQSTVSSTIRFDPRNTKCTNEKKKPKQTATNLHILRTRTIFRTEPLEI